MFVLSCSCCLFTFVFAICLGFPLPVYFILIVFSLATLCGLRALGSLVKDWAWASGVVVSSPGPWTAR